MWDLQSSQARNSLSTGCNPAGVSFTTLAHAAYAGGQPSIQGRQCGTDAPSGREPSSVGGPLRASASPLEALAAVSSGSSSDGMSVYDEILQLGAHDLMAWAESTLAGSLGSQVACADSTTALGHGVQAACAAALQEQTRQQQQPSSSLLTFEQLVHWVESCSQSAPERLPSAARAPEDPGLGGGVLGGLAPSLGTSTLPVVQGSFPAPATSSPHGVSTALAAFACNPGGALHSCVPCCAQRAP